ncbi:MAG: serine/threonine-protein kinase [Planctomycetes bacterium]|jgi:serine/threonine protein kinase|nr:serine/threonine-protein kinase [Planctomycetota bacterium]
MSNNDPRWNRIKDLFAAAQAVPEAERETFLRERGAGRDTVHEVLDLLGAHVATEEQAGDAIGPYKLLESLGEGGFGTVWMAEQRAPVQRRVALKVLKAGMDSAQVLARFEQERQALALMQHPNIAQVYDAGTTPRGRPFFVMELVKGIPITDYAARERLSLSQRLELFVQVCRAVQHAHQKGVVHRDIKPRNVLVATVDGRPMAKVIDFGIAKATSGRLTERTLFTEHRAMIGTFEYMSPEQAEGLLDVDTRADVYSLGALLYELLTGSTPFAVDTLLAAGVGEMLRTLREVDPERPSVRVSSKAGAGWAARGSTGGSEPKELFGSLRGDLDWVVMKALEKDRARRYGSAGGLAADLERYLAGDAVEAVPPSLGYRVKKFVRRNRGLVASVAVIAGVAAAALTFVLLAEHESAIAQWGGQLNSHGSRIATAMRMADDRSYDSAVAELDRCPEELRGWEWRHASVVVEEAPRLLVSPAPVAWTMAHDGVHVLCLEKSPPKLVVYDTRSRAKVAIYSLPSEGPERVTAIKDAAIIDGSKETSEPGKTNPWTVCVHLPSAKVHAMPQDSWLDAGPNYATVTKVEGGKLVRIHDVGTGNLIQEHHVDCREVNDIQFLPSGRWMIYKKPLPPDSEEGHAAQQGNAVMVDLASPERRINAPDLLWPNPHGGLHLGMGKWLFDDQQGVVSRAIPFHITYVDSYINDVTAVARNGDRFDAINLKSLEIMVKDVPVSGFSGTRTYCDVKGHRCLEYYRGDISGSFAVENGERLGAEPGVDRDLMAQCNSLHWISDHSAGIEVSAARPPYTSLPEANEPVLTLRPAERNGCYAIRATSATLDTLFCPDTGVPHRYPHTTPIHRAAASGNGQAQLRLHQDGKLFVSPAASADAFELLAAITADALALDHTGANAALLSGDRILHLRVVAGSQPRTIAQLEPNEPTPAIAVHEHRIAVGRHDGSLSVHDARSTTSTDGPTSPSPITHLSWSPDGTLLLIGTSDGAGTLLRASDLRRTAQLDGHRDAINGASWSPNGDRVFTCAKDRTVRCWPTAVPSVEHVLSPLLTLNEPEIAGHPTTVLMTPDGERLVCGYDDGSVRVWDSVPWSERAKHVPPLFPLSPK